ncbi:MAG: hypothetical protein KJZ56_00145 [Flavobacteriales bacterium]|nr:hypothetical protein [Flavobacteriales bacterium]
MNDSTKTIINTSIDYTKPALIIETNWYFIAAIILIAVLYHFFRKKIKSKVEDLFTDETSIEIDTGLLKYNQKIKRNYQNLYIANRIYIELITRKAALPIDENKDVIKEVYDSWYILFKTIREEIKNLPGEILVDNHNTKKLIDLTVQILNEGLRPHLTEYQAEFRKWYDHELKKDTDNKRSPQQIQKDFPKHDQLIKSMLDVNETLRAYSEQLKKFVNKN